MYIELPSPTVRLMWEAVDGVDGVDRQKRSTCFSPNSEHKPADIQPGKVGLVLFLVPAPGILFAHYIGGKKKCGIIIGIVFDIS